MEQQTFETFCPVVPGERVGPFRLGMSLHEALGVIQARSNNTLRSLEPPQQTRILFSRGSPVEKPVIIDVQDLGMKLRFEPRMQRLYVVDCYDISKAGLSFQDHLFGGGDRSTSSYASLRSLYEVLGVTHSGFRKQELGKDAFCLQYPGMLIAFRVPENEPLSGIPLILQDGTSPGATRLLVHEIEFPRQTGRLLATPTTRSVDVIVREDRPVEVVFKDFSSAVLMLGETCCQDVLSSFGSPSRIHVKRYEPIGTMVRRQQDTASLQGDTSADYFYNYADLGVDMLFDGTRHVLRKIILRTNLMGHPAFGLYNKCSFQIKYIESSTSNASNRKGQTSWSNQKTKKATFEDLLTTPSTSGKSGGSSEKQVTCDDHWLLISKKLDLADDKPMVHERAGQPFGPCLLFGYRRSVFEVDMLSQHICSLTVF